MPSRYPEVYAAWKQNPAQFWGEAAREIDWYKPWDRVFDPYAGQYGRWFAGGSATRPTTASIATSRAGGQPRMH